MHMWSTIQQLYPKHLLSAGCVRKTGGSFLSSVHLHTESRSTALSGLEHCFQDAANGQRSLGQQMGQSGPMLLQRTQTSKHNQTFFYLSP